MALLSVTMPLGFHGVHVAPPTSIVRMSFIDGKPGSVALPTDMPGQVRVCCVCSASMLSLSDTDGKHHWISFPPQGPFGVFDPLGFAPESPDKLRLFREAELTHGRVAMVAALGFLVQEGFHPMFEVNGPVIRQLDEVLKFSNGMLGGSCLLMAIMFAEINRARIGWVEPEVKLPILTQEVQGNIIGGGKWTLREGYLPGDVGFDPLGMKPKDEAGLLAMQDKELNNGRLAMIAVAGMTAQELVTGTTLF